MTVSGTGLASGALAGALHHQGLALDVISKTLAHVGNFARQTTSGEAHKGVHVNKVV